MNRLKIKRSPRSGKSLVHSQADTKYASARIKLKTNDASLGLAISQKTRQTVTHGDENLRLCELLVNEFYRKRGYSIRCVPSQQQV